MVTSREVMAIGFGKVTHSLRSKIIMMGCGMALGSAVLVGGLNYIRTVDRTLVASTENLAAQTRLMAARFQSAYDTVRNEVRIVSRTPPIQGLIHSMANNEIDPRDGSTTELWRTRLETIFTSVMQESPHYTQMRYIKLTDGGRELVRVNRIEDGLISVPVQQLQRKGNEPYVRAVIKGRESFFFSKVTLNREHGKIEEELIPTIRAVMPVKDAKGNLFGMLVINVDFEALMRRMFYAVRPTKNAFITNQSGDYVEYDPKRNTVHLEYHERFTKTSPEFITKIQDIMSDKTSSQNEALFIEGEDFVYYVRMQIEKNTNKEYVGAILRVPRDELLAGAEKTRQETIILTVVLVLVSVCTALLISNKLTIPLMQMTENIRKVKNHETQLKLPVELNDEIGELARAFEAMIADITRTELEREKLIKALELSNKELDEFAYIASHDLKAPLRVIDNASRWLEEDFAEYLDDDGRENMELLRNRVTRMERLLDDLLEYSSIGRKIDESYAETISGDKMAENILLLLDIPEKFNLHFSAQFSKIHLYRMPLQHVLLNLINNAIKHHDKDTGTVEVEVKEQGNQYIFTVSDNGPGIAEEFQERVFKMFQTLKSRDRAEGSGMGLTMVKKYIEHFGGTITLESEEGKGCCFRFTWPKPLRNVMKGDKYG